MSSTAEQASTEAAAMVAVSTVRQRIDDLDHDIIELLRRRQEVSQQIQQIRTGAGGQRVEPAREELILERYRSAFGGPGRDIATALLRICRG
ncbi:hypothetical protein GCM10012275_24900 [Longimycelium tulufanense]|uniref:Chorismate mutase domain-containing protein n=1 Tax=Longimycelium tulufanense TaxID=907463 RepID=A0A8J3CB16_9PSEU|nr:chorismate mutase [Longimycelium tulufanense]GGM52931.1 hypothetical protein GCM10012275_24900 [Longimycelium tulufanense]